TNTVCVPECYVKKTTKWVYRCCDEPLCLPPFRHLFGGGGCDDHHCEHPRTVRFLIKKKRICEEEAVKCVPSEAPCCAPAGGCHQLGGPPAVMTAPRPH